jgi:hypothetical protein
MRVAAANGALIRITSIQQSIDTLITSMRAYRIHSILGGNMHRGIVSSLYKNLGSECGGPFICYYRC